MKVLHVLDRFLPVSENWIYPQITRVPGAVPGVMCEELLNRELFPLPGVPLFQNPPPWTKALGLPRLINSIAFRLGRGGLVAGAAARRWGPDLLHAHFGTRGWQALTLQRRLGVPLITSFYGLDAWQLPASSELWRKRYRELFSEGHLFLAEGPKMGERLVAIGCPPERIRVVRLGVEPANVTFTARQFTAPLRVVMMARFVEKKGLPTGLRACAEAIRRGAKLEVVIVGGATPGDLPGERIARELRELAGQESLRDRVTFAGFLKPAEARAQLQQSDVFLCPSQHSAEGDAEGGSPVALTEAMGQGLLCIGTRHCDIPEVIRHGETGLLGESEDPAGLASLLVEAGASPERTQALCVRGRAHIEEHFSIARQVRALGEIYRELWAGCRSGREISDGVLQT